MVHCSDAVILMGTVPVGMQRHEAACPLTYANQEEEDARKRWQPVHLRVHHLQLTTDFLQVSSTSQKFHNLPQIEPASGGAGVPPYKSEKDILHSNHDN